MGLERHDFIEKRAHKRVPVFHHARAVGSEGQPLSLVIVDLSAGGLMARCDHPLTTGDRLQVHVPGIGLRSAHVCWALGGRIGCEFDTPISLEAYLAVTAK
ncbi:MAG: PilZ domain-containing protein [Sphingomonas bacterium]